MVVHNPQAGSEPPTILLVCEARASLQQAADALKAEGFRTHHAPSLYRAIVEQTGSPAEVVLIDASPLLERDLEAFEVLRSLAPASLLLASLSPSAREKARAALDRGADAYVLEPIDAREVAILLRRSLERRASPAESRPLGEKLASLARFAGGVAHEVNNPLTTISGWVQLSLADMAPDDPRRHTFETMQEEIERIARIVRNLLCFAGQPPIDEEPVDLNALLDELVTSLPHDGVHVASYLHDELPLILANREQVRRACEHLLRNALENLDGRGELLVGTRPAPGKDEVLVEIADDGTGIPPENLSRIFDPFFSEGNGGTGLGLSAAYGIIQGHGGSIEVISREAHGTRFLVRLPLHRLRTRNRIANYAR